ncbi:MAG: DUF411 domain-containing protein [Porticoccaceae bacterium]|nr:DUF411 domain-containing protein [Porticoccaceae bacterium]
MSLAACSEQSSEPALLQVSNVGSVDVSTEQSAEQGGVQVSSATIAMDLYKSPSCGCCGKWAEHAEHRGFSLTSHHPADLNKLKLERGVAAQYQSCHTAVSAEGFVFEGHIPARFIQQFLAAPPAGAIGLAVPGMPAGSPGMEMGDRFTPYQVLLLKGDGGADVFAEVNTPLEQF